MAGFGLMSAGSGPFGSNQPASINSVSGQIVSSRRIDALGRLVQTDDGTGAFEAMSDTLQRAYIALKRSVVRTDKILGDFESHQRNAIYTGLRFLTKQPKPALRIDAVNIDTSKPSAPFTTVTVTDLTNGAQTTIRLPSLVHY